MSIRVRRARVRLALASGAAAALSVLSVIVLLERDDGPPPRRHVVAPPPVVTADIGRVEEPEAVMTAELAQVTSRDRVELVPGGGDRATRSTPRSLGATFRQDAALEPAELASWVQDEALDPRVRYGALRRLEQEDPAAAVTVALALLDDVTPLVRLNAIALLTRANDPRAAAALEKLDPRSRQLALALVRR